MRNRLPLILVAPLVLCACSGSAPAQPSQSDAAQCPSGMWVRSEIFFGRSRPDGSEVSDEAWQAFLRSSIIPRFPAGFTVLDGLGAWRSVNGETITEKSKILSLVHPPGPESAARIEAVPREYTEQFSQEAVMKLESCGAVSF